uniref:Uncharacterized protein n=1 Tax=Panagrolaimus superbus TaxID=310955 RepID=A0A914Y1P0_9BILA
MILVFILLKLSYASVVYKAIHAKNYPIVNHKKAEHESFQTISSYENQNDTLKVTERNIGAGNNNSDIVGITSDGFFKPLSASSKKVITIQAENCGKKSFPHRFFIDESGKPMMLCEPYHCLKAEKVECKSNIQMEECNKSNEWITGFIGKNNGTHDLMEVECCHYKDIIFTAFVKTFNVTVGNAYDHDIVVENERLVAIDFINNVKKIEISKDSSIYAFSVYRMRCPASDTYVNTSANVLDEHIRDFANTKIDSKEKAELFASTIKYIIAELDKRAKFDNITLLNENQKTNATNNETSSLMQNHPMFESISTKEEASLQASAMRLVAKELAKGPYGNAFMDLNEPTAARPRKESKKCKLSNLSASI